MNSEPEDDIDVNLVLRLLRLIAIPIFRKISKESPVSPLIGSTFIAYFLSAEIISPISAYFASLKKSGITGIEIFIVFIIFSLFIVGFFLCHAYFWSSIDKDWVKNNGISYFKVSWLCLFSASPICRPPQKNLLPPFLPP